MTQEQQPTQPTQPTHTPIEQDQTPYTGDKPAEQVDIQKVPDPQPSPLPVDEGTVERAKEFEEQRKVDLDAEREEHNRRTAGGDPEP